MVDNDFKPVRGQLSAQETGLLLEQLSAGVSGRQPLDQIFRALADDLPERRLRQVATRLAEQFEQGADMESAFAALTPVLPAHLRRGLAIGARSGNLSGILAGLSESELARRQMQRGLRSVLTYPLLVLTFFTLVLLFLSLTVIPYFGLIYDDFGLELPIITIFTLNVAGILPRALLLVATCMLIVMLFGYVFAGRRFFHWIRSALPLFGRAWMWSGQHEFATLMATLTGQQIPTSEALSCTAESLRDRNLAWATRHVCARCAEGATLSQSLRDSIHFDPLLTSLAEWGEQGNVLAGALREAAVTYELQMQLYTQFLQRIIPPLMLTLVASTLFVLVAALMIPLVGMIDGLTG